MPEKFQDIGLPSFWMSYIEVDDIDACIATAEQLGGKVEVRPMPISEHARIALIRDPLGAGFTLIEGSGFELRSSAPRHGAMAWNGLYVSNAEAVMDFYSALFGWRFEPTDFDKNWQVLASHGGTVASLDEIPTEIRGKDEFWGIHFAVDDLQAAEATIGRYGGEILYREEDGQTTLAKDPDGAAFFLRTGKGNSMNKASTAKATKAWPWKTALAIVAIWVAVALDQNWVWGVLFLLWTWPAIRLGQTYFVEPIDNRSNPIIFWALVLSWIVLSLLLVAVDLVGV